MLIVLCALVSRHPTLKKGSGETVYKKLSVRNFDWMTFTGYVSVRVLVVVMRHFSKKLCNHLIL